MTDTATTGEETAATIAVLPNDTDADGDTLTLTGVGVPAHGTAVANPNGTVTYTPALNYSGADTFTYTITDNQGATATGSVAVTVTSTNDPPVAVNDSYSTNEDVTLTVPPTGVAVNDLDPDGNTLTASVVTAPTHGTLTLNGDGSFSYTPAAQLQRPRRVHLQGHGRHRRLERRHGHHHGGGGQRRAGGPRRRVTRRPKTRRSASTRRVCS